MHTYNPILDRNTGKPSVNDKGEILYSNTPTQQYKDRHKRVADLQKQNSKLQGEIRKSQSKPAPKVTAPQSGTFSISKAIQNGLSETEARAKAERAKQAGWKVVE